MSIERVPQTRSERFTLAWNVSRRVMSKRGPGVALAAFRMVWGASGAPGWSGDGGGVRSLFGWQGTLPGTQRNLLREVGDPSLNPAVSIGLYWIADQLPQAKLQVLRNRRDGSADAVPRHPLIALVNRPNQSYTGKTLWAATATSYSLDGNAYWYKVRGLDGDGPPVQLWYIPHWEMSPRFPSDGSAFISDYLYRPGGRGTGYPIPVEDVVHFRFSLDYSRGGGRLGVSRIKPILREILSDNEASTYIASLLTNMAIPGVIVSPKKEVDDEFTPEQRQTLEDIWVSKFTGDGRGKPLISGIPLDVASVGFSPESLVLDKIRTIPEDRITAALRIPAMVLGLTSGANAKTYANMSEARRSAYEDGIEPQQDDYAETLVWQLLPDFAGSQNDTIGWDRSNVTALSENQDALVTRLTAAYQGGLITRNEGRERLRWNLPPVEDQPAAVN